uniref:RING-type domain-containing protein n=1 Tax=Periophthalmus magnuspinnatus TaxID=409849 RepID=A0A3B4BGX7_9GOBI
MASGSSSLCEEQFECPICTDIFSNPVSLPCGHNFCDGCIRRHWEGRKVCKCPLCKREFNRSLKLHVNTLFRDIVDSYKQDYVVSDSEKPSGAEDVLCDCCLESRRRAAQTCLVCLTSFCKKHLKPHLKVSSLKTHTLTDPVPNLQQKMCPKHNRILEETSCDQTKVCVLCANNENQAQSEKDVHYIKITNSRKTKKTKKKQAAPRVIKTEDTDETERLENAYIWHNNVLYSFSPLPPHCGFSTGRVYYNVPNVGNSSYTIGVVNKKMRGEMVFRSKIPNPLWCVVLFNTFVLACHINIQCFC